MGRENNWVIVPIDNYEDSIQNAAYCVQEPLQDDLNIEAFRKLKITVLPSDLVEPLEIIALDLSHQAHWLCGV